MKKKLIGVAVLSLSALAAQAQPMGGEIARIYLNTPKPGMEQKFLEGRKQHMDWHRKQNDAWSWLTWEVLTGDRAGSYYTGTFFHDWKDFDGREKFDAADEADAAINLAPYTAASVNFIDRFLTKASRPSGGAEPAPFAQITYYYVKFDGVSEFTRALERVKQALDKANWPVHANWYGLVNGGEGPVFVLAIDRSSWAEFGPTAKPFDMAVAEATSVGEANALFDAFSKHVVKTYTEVLRYRPDLSYVAPAK